jgi:phosphatidylglycerol lysyltransferase
MAMQGNAGLGGIVRQQLWRGGLGLACLGLCVGALYHQIGGFDTALLGATLAAVSPLQWAGALVFSALSYLAIGHYDLILMRHLALPHDPGQARRAGITALALSQTLGLGLLTGALVRWRMLPGLSLVQALRLTLAVSATFLAAAAVVGAVILASLHGFWATVASAAGLVVLVGLVILRPVGMRWRWPNVFAIGAMLACSAADLAGACAALWCVLPPGTAIGDLIFRFLPALAAGLISGAPAGLGAFDLLLVQGLPALRTEQVMAAILAWRLAYFALPAVLAAAAMAVGPRRALALHPLPALPPLWPEAPLQRQGHLSPLPGTGWIIGRTGHVLVAFGDVPQPARALPLLRRAARAEARLPALYKAPARLAARSRAMGMTAVAIGKEASINPARFTLAGPAMAGLRRKLRQAKAAQISTAHEAQPRLAELSGLAQDWATQMGAEKGFSMGRFDPAYVAGQRVYVARQAGVAVAFVTFHETGAGWTLDLMRATPSAPPGSMHALITQALADAAQGGIARVGLAAVPITAFAAAPPLARLVRRIAPKAGWGQGLYQFKSSFGPTWTPVYLCAPNPLALALAALSIARAVHYPPPLTRRSPDAGPDQMGFASEPQFWHSQG